MNVISELTGIGFDRVSVLDGADCGVEARRLVLAFIRYEAAAGPESLYGGAVIHPYYPVSQAAYRAARQWTDSCRKAGLQVRLAPEVRVKPIFARLTFLRTGRNTLAYLPETGSRFHVQIFLADEDWEVTDRLTEPRAPECGECKKCREACPTGAIGEREFDPERCLRYWMLNGQTPPDFIREHMGNRLIGCDLCQACCPMNRPGTAKPLTVSLEKLMDGSAVGELRPLIGSNYARKGRLRLQAEVILSSLGQTRKESVNETPAD